MERIVLGCVLGALIGAVLVLCCLVRQHERRLDFYERLISQARRESQAAHAVSNETNRMLVSVMNGTDARVDQAKLLEQRMKYRKAAQDANDVDDILDAALMKATSQHVNAPENLRTTWEK
jgi:hypothetical protein